MRSKKTLVRVVPVRVTPVTAAVATALGSIMGMGIATAAELPDELVVSATRRDTSVQEVPYSLSAIQGAQLEALQIRDLSDIARWAPGLYQVDQGLREANRLVMRGINASSIAAPELLRNTQGDRVSTYFGETPVYVNLAPIDLERVEVLRGPQGTLYGSRSLAGTVRYLPNAPQTDEMTLDGHVRGYAVKESSDLGYDVDGVINIPVIEDTLALRAVLGQWSRPGFVDQPYVVKQAGVSCPEPFFSDAGCTENDLESVKDTNDLDVTTARVSLLWDQSDTFSATLSYAYQREKSGGRQISSRESMAVITDPSTGGPLDIGDYASGMRFLEKNERENQIWNLTWTLQLDGAELLSTTSYNTYEQEGTRDQTDLLLLYGYGDFPAFSAFTDDVTDDEALTQEFRLVSTDESSRWDYIAGLYFQDVDGSQGSNEFAPNFDLFGPPLPNDQVTFIDVKRDTKETALFGELGYQVSDVWHVMAGARAFKVDDKIVDCIQFTLFDPAPSCDTGGADDEDILFKFGADAQVRENMKLYGLFSQGISLGGSNPDPLGTPLPDDLKFVTPERTDNFELGVRSTFADGRLTVNAAAFMIDWNDIQVDEFFGSRIITVNAGEARSNGIEIDVNAILNDNWELLAGIATASGSITSGPDAGQRLPGSPEETVKLGVIYNSQLDNGLELSGSYRISAQSDVKPYLDSPETLSGFAIHTATIGLTGDRWSAMLFVDNLLDKYAVTGVRDDPSFIGTDGGINDIALRRYFENIITPRTIGVDLRYRFK